jgi:hypothetical protein
MQQQAPGTGPFLTAYLPVSQPPQPVTTSAFSRGHYGISTDYNFKPGVAALLRHEDASVHFDIAEHLNCAAICQHVM